MEPLYGKGIRIFLSSTLVAEGGLESDIWNGFKGLYPTSTRPNRGIWQCVTDLEPKKQGLVVYLSLPDKIHKSWNVSVQDLNKDDGLNVLINKIISFYAEDMNALAFMAYDKFENFRRSGDMNIIDYINELERLNKQIKHFGMERPTSVLTYKVFKKCYSVKWKTAINTSHSSVSHRREHEKAVESIFDSSTSSQSSEGIDIKSKLVFYTSKTNNSGSYKDNTNHYPEDGYRYWKFTSSRGRNNRQKQNARENND